jgi:hypothetical protein
MIAQQADPGRVAERARKRGFRRFGAAAAGGLAPDVDQAPGQKRSSS